MLKVVYDTNVVVSATLHPERLPASLIALAIGGRVQLCLSPAILEEYHDVLRRPKFGFERKAITRLLKDLQLGARLVEPTRRVSVIRDDADNRFLECARAAKADYLVTGNTKHFPFEAFEKTTILSPTEFACLMIT